LFTGLGVGAGFADFFTIEINPPKTKLMEELANDKGKYLSYSQTNLELTW
jgi:hypothetical protein